MQKLNLDALVAQRHSVTKGDKTYTVRPITARIASLFSAAVEVEGAQKVTAFGDVVAALIPDMPRHDVDDLTIGQMAAIVQLASTEVDIVEDAADPNGARPVAPGNRPTALAAT